MIRLSLVLAFSSVLIAACGSDEGGDTAGATTGDPSGTSGDPGATSGDPGATSGDPGATSGGGADPTGAGNGGSGPSGPGSGGNGNGGNGTGGAPPSGACTNAADNAILTSSDVPAIVEQCATESFGAEPATKECIATETGLSDPCVTCFDDTIQCTVMNCIGECFGGMTPECTACMDANCTPAFEACSGLDQ